MMSHKRQTQKLPPQQNWRGDADIISMETRILPKNTVPPSSKAIPQVQIPFRNALQSSATPPNSARPLFSSRKRPQSSSSIMDPTPSKRHRIDLIVPKDEPEDSPTITPPNSALPSAMAPETSTSVETPNIEPSKQSYVHGLGVEMLYFRFGGQILPSSIHRKVLCDKVPAFKQELKRLQANENILDFPEGMGATFEALIEWGYRGKLPKVTKRTNAEDCYAVIKLACLALKYREVPLVNACVDSIMRYLKIGRPRWTLQWVGYVYENTSRGSPLRALMVKWFMEKLKKTNDESRWTTEQFAEVANGHPDMIHDFFALFRTLDVNVGNPRADDTSIYHVNEDDLSLVPEPKVDSRDNTPLSMYTAGSPEVQFESPPMESTPPTASDDEIDVADEKDSTFNGGSEFSNSEVAADHLPTTRSNRKKSRSSKRAGTAPA